MSAVSFTQSLPIDWAGSDGTYWIEGRAEPTYGDARRSALFRAVGPDYFSTLGIPLRSGREIDQRDTVDGPKAVVINESMARASWPGQSPLGQRIRIGWTASTAEWMTIVGVVADTRQGSLDQPIRQEIYTAAAQHPIAALSLQIVARTSLDPLLLAEGLRQLSRTLDPEVPVNVTTAERKVERTLVAPRFRTLLLALFAGAALLLAMIGVAGVMACIVTERRAEIGIRMAVGARPAHILGQFIVRALRLALVGLAIGLSAALACTRLLQGLLFGVGTADPRTLALVSLLMVVAAVGAASWPAVRAARTSPMSVLRND